MLLSFLFLLFSGFLSPSSKTFRSITKLSIDYFCLRNLLAHFRILLFQNWIAAFRFWHIVSSTLIFASTSVSQSPTSSRWQLPFSSSRTAFLTLDFALPRYNLLTSVRCLRLIQVDIWQHSLRCSFLAVSPRTFNHRHRVTRACFQCL